jgi:hypothetical protein
MSIIALCWDSVIMNFMLINIVYLYKYEISN